MGLTPPRTPGYAIVHIRYRALYLSIVDVPSRTVAYYIAKMQSSKTYVALLPVQNFFAMEVWNGMWKKILMWNERLLAWNGRKMPVWNMEKLPFIPFHTMPCRQHKSNKIVYKVHLSLFFFFYAKYNQLFHTEQRCGSWKQKWGSG